jgi:hypothetical protein
LWQQKAPRKQCKNHRRRPPRQDKPETAKQPRSPRRSRQTEPSRFLGDKNLKAPRPVRRPPLARRLPASSRRTGATEPWWATTGPEPAVRRATTDRQLDGQECGQVGRLRRGPAVACRDRDSGCCWAGPALIGGRSWPRRPVRMAPTPTRTTPKNPVRVVGGPTRLLPADSPWGSSAPRGTPTAFPSLARKSLAPNDPKAA